jgi:NADPH:quinone reductase-like Zn-dependent oxidoreductase
MAEATMRAVVMDRFGGPEVLRLGEAPRPSAGPGQVLIRVAATSVNRADTQQRTGNYPPPPGESEILGLEVAGAIEALGEGVTGWQPGDRVMTLVGGGGYAEYAAASASTLLPVPGNLDFTRAAAITEVWITAYLNVFREAGL